MLLWAIFIPDAAHEFAATAVVDGSARRGTSPRTTQYMTRCEFLQARAEPSEKPNAGNWVLFWYAQRDG